MGNYTHLGVEERKHVQLGLKGGKSRREIADELGRDHTTISREIRRNMSKEVHEYMYESADAKAKKRRNIKQKKLVADEKLRKKVIEDLRKGWSPEIISGRLKLEDTGMRISAESIYQFIYSKEGKEADLYEHLLRKKKQRGGFKSRKTRKTLIKDRVSIHERPQEINDRSRPGDFEGDLFFSNGSQSANIGVLVERKSRYVILGRNQSKQTNEVVNNCAKWLLPLPKSLRRSVTFDNGMEFASHHLLREKLSMQTYFCDPHSPWQKGQVENANSMLRWRIPKNLPANKLSDEFVEGVMQWINNRPRKCLGFRTPKEVFFSFLQSGALQT